MLGDYLPGNYLLGDRPPDDHGSWSGFCALLPHAHPGSPRDVIVTEFCAATLNFAMLRLRFGLPSLLCDPSLHRPGEGKVEVVDCSELL
jgi:hypothetical protein